MYLQNASIATPLGAEPGLVANAIKSGISCVQESAYISKSGERIKMALVPEAVMRTSSEQIRADFPELTNRQIYLLRLAEAALSKDFIASLPANPLPLFMAGPDGLFASYSQGLFPNFIKALGKISDIPFDVSSSRVFSLGRAGVLYAIEHAFRYMESVDIDQVLVGGVDCFRDHLLLAKLDAEARVLCNGSVDGFASAEGAGFLLLSRSPRPFHLSDRTIKLYPPGTDSEAGAFYSDEAYRGDGLGSAVSKALTNSRQSGISKIFSSMNGESYWARELGVMMTRNSSAFSSQVKVEHPADCFGDLGAAFCSVMLACIGEQDEGQFLLYGSSDSSSRAAICIDLVTR